MTANVSGAPDVSRAAAADLAAARNLIRAGVPVFRAPAAPGTGLGCRLPAGWQHTEPDEALLDAWRPGDALCAVMGRGLDLIDHDPRGDGGVDPLETLRAAGELPEVIAEAASPSGGRHLFVRSTGVGSRDDLLPGLDVKAGKPNGDGRGFAFLAPTERASKVTGKIRPYRWTQAPPASLDAFPAYTEPAKALAIRVRKARGELPTSGVSGAPTDGAALSVVEALADASRHRREHTGPIPEGSRHSALVSYAGYLRTRGVGLDLAERLMLTRLADCEQPPKACTPVTKSEALGKLRDAYARYSGGVPDLQPIELDESGAPVNPLDVDVLDEDQIEALPDREPLIDALIDRGTYVVIYAEPKAGKSLFALDLAECVAHGIAWNGRECQQESVLWVAAEGSGSMRIRQPAWRKSRGVGKSGRFSMVRRAVPLDDPVAIAHLADLIKRKGAGFVVIDTWADSLGDADEDKSSQTRAAHRAIREQLLAATPGGRGVVVVLAHARKSPRSDGLPELRGSSAFRGAVDAAFALIPEESGRVLARQTDNRDGARCEPFAFRIGAGSVLAYETPAAAGYMAAPKTRQETGAAARRERVLKVVRQHADVPGQPATTSLVQRVTGMPRPTAQRHLTDLEAFGDVRRKGTGRGTTWHLTDPEEEGP